MERSRTPRQREGPWEKSGGVYNDDHALPDAPDRTWHERDANYQAGRRRPERIAYSTDGLVYYTPGHHKTFKQPY
ncbi:ribonuclease domain-containing protein [Tractidigestivibacter sp.]|uniref:ribonuclease domain-containing protein n=1 Tax=Tractidigestivibacter sp. TaxID=2847320 RepID=UPI0039C33E95